MYFLYIGIYFKVISPKPVWFLLPELVQRGQQDLHAHWLLSAQRHPPNQAGQDEQRRHQQRTCLGI